MLFVPAHRPHWAVIALASGADAVILDLEDAVPEAERPRARRAVAEVIATRPADGPPIYVRINSARTSAFEADLSVVRPGIEGLLLSKCRGLDDIATLEARLTERERATGLEQGMVEIVPLCETAEGIYNAHSICRTPRVKRLVGACNWPAGGDTHADLRYMPDEDGLEPPWLSARLMLDARAAGIENLLAGPPLELHDRDRLVRHAKRARRLGADGSLAIHPVQVEPINSTFTPTQSEIEHAIAVRDAMAAAVSRGDAATRLGDEMIDEAHARSSLALLARARRLGLNLDD